MENNISKLQENSIEKPPVVYHGSPNKDITFFTPKPKEFNGVKDNFFFASPRKDAALAYLAQGDYPWSSGMYYDGIIRSVFPITRSEFLKNDKGGALYTLDSKSFTSSQDRLVYEWVTKEEVSPIHQEVFDSVLQAMQEVGIRLYFLGDLQKYEDFCKLSSSREKIDYLESFT